MSTEKIVDFSRFREARLAQAQLEEWLGDKAERHFGLIVKDAIESHLRTIASSNQGFRMVNQELPEALGSTTQLAVIEEDFVTVMICNAPLTSASLALVQDRTSFDLDDREIAEKTYKDAVFLIGRDCGIDASNTELAGKFFTAGICFACAFLAKLMAAVPEIYIIEGRNGDLHFHTMCQFGDELPETITVSITKESLDYNKKINNKTPEDLPEDPK